MMEQTSNPILHRLQQTLETGAPREEVAEALEAAEELGEALPPLLRFRARERIDADRFLDRRRICFGIGVSVLLFLGAIVAVGLTTLDRLRAANRDEATLQQLIDGGQWEEAQAFLDSLDEETRSRESFAKGQQQVQEELERQQKQTEEFEQLVEQIRSDPTQAIDEVIVKRLGELATTDEQKEIAAEMSALADEQRLLREAERVQDQTQQFESLQESVDRFFESQAEPGSEARSNELRALQQQLQQFASKARLSNPELAEAAKQISALLVREEQRAQQLAGRSNLIDAITASVGKADRYLRSIRQFTDSFPNDPMAQELKKSVADGKQVQATEVWIDLLGDSTFSQPDMADADRSRQWLEKLARAESLAAEHPFAKNILPWRPHYQAIANRDESIKKLRELLQSKLMGRMYVYPDVQQGWYYSDVSPNRESATAHVVEYFADLSLNRKTKNFGSRFKQQILPQVRLAGHSAYAENAMELVSSMNESDFTQAVYRLLVELRALKVDTEIDPIFKLELTRQLLAIGVQGSRPLAAGFGDWKETLDASDFPWDTNWMTPGDSDPKVAQARDEAKSLLQGIRDWEGRVRRMSDSFREFRQPRPQPPAWIGWVTRSDNRFTAVLRSPAGDGQLLAVSPDQKSGKIRQVEISPPAEGLIGDIDDSAALVVGAPICLLPPEEPAEQKTADKTTGIPDSSLLTE